MGALNTRPSRVPPRPTEMELYERLVAAEAGRADAATKRADLAEMRYVTDMAKYRMQYCWRSVLECLLRSSADAGNTSPGGALFKQHLMRFVLAQPDIACTTFSPAALVLYKDIVNFPTFRPCNNDAKLPSFVAAIKDVYNLANDDCHQLPDINMSEVGVACGGGGPEKMLKHAFLIASLQKYCIQNNKRICPPFDKVAVLSASLDTVVAHVINGEYVPVSEEAEAEAEAEADSG